jgi:methionyl-tRNA formyltransferase
MGTSSFAVPILKELINLNQNITKVFTSPPKKANRGMKSSLSPIALAAPEDLRDQSIINSIKSMKLDLIIVIAYGFIIPKEILNIPKYGCYNIHASILPRWRGAAPIQRSIIEGDQVSGVSFIKIDEGLDTGDIVFIDEIEIKKKDTQNTLSSNLAELGVRNLSKFLNKFEYKFELIKQSDEVASYANKILKSETRINWNESAELIERKIRAFNPKPGAWFEMNGKRIKVFEAEISNGHGMPGEILNDKFEIACGKDSLNLKVLQKEGKNQSNIESFRLGNKALVGNNLD